MDGMWEQVMYLTCRRKLPGGVAAALLTVLSNGVALM